MNTYTLKLQSLLADTINFVLKKYFSWERQIDNKINNEINNVDTSVLQEEYEVNIMVVIFYDMQTYSCNTDDLKMNNVLNLW